MTPITLAVARDDRHAQKRLEALLLQLGNVLRALVLQQLVGDEGRLAMLRRPPREALASLEHDPAGEMVVRSARSPQDESLTVVVDEIDEARMNGARVRQEAHDGGEHLVQLERRGDRRDDLVEDSRLSRSGRHTGDRRTVSPGSPPARGRNACSRRNRGALSASTDGRGPPTPRRAAAGGGPSGWRPRRGGARTHRTRRSRRSAAITCRISSSDVKKCGPSRIPDVGTEVAQDLALGQLAVHGRELGHVHGHRPAAPRRVARAAHLELRPRRRGRSAAASAAASSRGCAGRRSPRSGRSPAVAA